MEQQLQNGVKSIADRTAHFLAALGVSGDGASGDGGLRVTLVPGTGDGVTYGIVHLEVDAEIDLALHPQPFPAGESPGSTEAG